MILIELWHIRKVDFLVWLVSFFATLFLGASIGLLIALGFSILVVVYRASTPHVAILGRLPRTTVWRNVQRFPDALVISGLLVLRIDADFFFANIRFIHDAIVRLVEAESSKVHVLLLDLSAVSDIDFSALLQLHKTMQWLHARTISVMATAVNGAVRDMLRRSGFLRLIGEENVYWLHADAVRVAKELIRQKRQQPEEGELKQLPDEYERTFSEHGSSGKSFAHLERAKRSETFWNRLI
jgi:MFS superfamily sulfate permease-like transporter